MEMKPNRRLIVSIGGMAAAIAVLVGLYVVVVRPRTKAWRDVRVEIKKSDKRLADLKKMFRGQDDPKAEIKILRQEFTNLQKANASLNKIKKPGIEAKDLPDEIKDPDPKLQVDILNEYMKEVMSVSEENITKDLEEIQIPAPDFKLYNKMYVFPEAAYYMNRANGLQGIINAIVRTKSETGGEITFAELKLEDYKKGSRRREASRNVLSYSVEMTMNLQSLMSLMYNLQEEEGYYYVSNMTVKPAKSRRFSSGDASGDFKLLVDARINTVMIFKSQMKSASRQAAGKSADAKQSAANLRARGGKFGGLMALAGGMKKTATKEIQEAADKKWYEFWK